MKIGFSADTVTLGGAPLQNLRGDLTSDGDGFAFESAQFRAPGFTEVTFSGKAGLSQSGFSFTGPADVASADPRLLLRWLDGRDDPLPDGPAKPIRLRADIAIGDEQDRVRTVEGRGRPQDRRWPPRLSVADGHAQSAARCRTQSRRTRCRQRARFRASRARQRQARPAGRSLARHRYRPRHDRRHRGAQRQCQAHLQSGRPDRRAREPWRIRRRLAQCQRAHLPGRRPARNLERRSRCARSLRAVGFAREIRARPRASRRGA